MTLNPFLSAAGDRASSPFSNLTRDAATSSAFSASLASPCDCTSRASESVGTSGSVGVIDSPRAAAEAAGGFFRPGWFFSTRQRQFQCPPWRRRRRRRRVPTASSPTRSRPRTRHPRPRRRRRRLRTRPRPRRSCRLRTTEPARSLRRGRTSLGCRARAAGSRQPRASDPRDPRTATSEWYIAW